MRIVAPRVIRANRGDLLSRAGILAGLRRRGRMDVVVAAEDAPGHALAGLRTVGYGPLHNLIPTPAAWRALRRADLVVWTGGLDLQDDSSLLKLVHTLLVFLSYRLLGLRIWAIAQGAGPLTTWPGRLLTRLILALVARFGVRDRASERLLRGIAPESALLPMYDGIFVADLALGAPSEDEQRWIDAVAERPAGRPLIGFNLRMWFHFASSILPYQCSKGRYQERSDREMAALVAACAATIRELRRRHDARVVLLSMYEPGVEPWEDDLPWLRRLAEALAHDPEVVVVERPLSLAGFCGLVGRLDLMIACRLHATLTAVRLGVPSINISYTLKGRDIFTDLGLGDRVIDLDAFMGAPDRLVARAEAVLADAAEPARVRAAVAKAVAHNEAVFDRLFGPVLTAAARP
jgi:polysaccharide pyruvyl transferase WcaK-like protein